LVIVHFVDIGGIDDHHCLTFLFIINNINETTAFNVPFTMPTQNEIYLLFLIQQYGRVKSG
jgi:hypothetical protein